MAGGLEGWRVRGVAALSFRAFEASSLGGFGLSTGARCANGPQTRQPPLERIEIAAPAPIAVTTTINSGAYHRRDDIRRPS